MPSFDKKGPLNEGPMTGRGMGICGGERGFRRGKGFRRGLGKCFSSNRPKESTEIDNKPRIDTANSQNS